MLLGAATDVSCWTATFSPLCWGFSFLQDPSFGLIHSNQYVPHVYLLQPSLPGVLASVQFPFQLQLIIIYRGKNREERPVSWLKELKSSTLSHASIESFQDFQENLKILGLALRRGQPSWVQDPEMVEISICECWGERRTPFFSSHITPWHVRWWAWWDHLQICSGRNRGTCILFLEVSVVWLWSSKTPLCGVLASVRPC